MQDSDTPQRIQQAKTLVWRNVDVQLSEKGKPTKKILDSVWGEAIPMGLTAILGPSGSGKTSLLNVLAGRTLPSSTGRMSVSADVQLNDCVINPKDAMVRKQIVFIEQNDSLSVSATPREAILFSAKLRLPATTSDKDLAERTENMIAELGLKDCADTITGGHLTSGISAGERKRTSIGIELVTEPSIVLLDEPTSGLDSFSALQLMKVLKNVVNSGASVLFSIHQPASDIFETFDRVILMNKGRVMYQGSPDIEDFFESRGYPLPPRYNPADWIVITAQTTPVSDLEVAGFFPKHEETTSLLPEGPKPAGSGKLRGGLGGLLKTSGGQSTRNINNRVGFPTQFSWLAKRDIRSMTRVRDVLILRLVLTGIVAILTGFVFWQVGNNNVDNLVNVQSHLGALVMVCLIAMFASALPTLIVFPEERPVFLHEYLTNHYSVHAYFLSRLVMEAYVTFAQMLTLSFITFFMIGFQLRFVLFFAIIYSLAMTSTAIAMIIGSTVKKAEVAMEYLPITLVVQVMFSGFFVAPDLMPAWLRWLQYLMPLSYSIKIAVEAEFNRDCGSITGNIFCQQVMETTNSNPDDVWWYWLALLSLFVSFRLLALLLLKLKADKQ